MVVFNGEISFQAAYRDTEEFSSSALCQCAEFQVGYNDSINLSERVSLARLVGKQLCIL